MPPADPTDRWRSLLAAPEAELDAALDQAALLIAAHARPGLDLAAELVRLDELAAGAGGPGTPTGRVVTHLFGPGGLRGDLDRYHDPANSYLDRVLDRRLGIPISLSVVLLAVGRRCGLPLEGVGMPGHFLVRDRDEPDLLIDAYGHGRRLDIDACRDLLATTAGPGVAFDPTLLAATRSRGILARMLANLDRTFRAAGDIASLSWVTTLRLAIPGLSVPARLDLVDLLTGLGRRDDALALIDDLLAGDELSPSAATALTRRALAARAGLN